MAATATPTSSPARSTCSRRSTTSRSTTRSTRTASSCAASRWAGRPAGSSPSITPGLWAAAAPGAGFSETADFLKVFQKETVQPTWYEQKLWHLYDCTDYAVNLFNCPTVAYSGEKRPAEAGGRHDGARPCEEEGIEMVHIIGPNTGHRYHARGQGGDQPPHRRDRRDRPRPRAARRSASPPGRCATTRCGWVHGRRPGAALGARAASMPRSSIRRQREGRPRRTSPALTLAMPPGACPLDVDAAAGRGDRRQTAEGCPGRCPTAPGRPISARSTATGERSRRPTTARSASGTACKARSTTRSWTASSWSSPTGKPLNDEGRHVGRRRDEARHRPLAQAIPRRGARQGRHGDHRRRHRRAQPRPLGRSRQQSRCWRRSPTSCRSAGTRSGVQAGEQDLRRRGITCRC